MERIDQKQLQRIRSQLETNSTSLWNKTELGQRISQQIQIIKCPYCDGSGHYLINENGYEFAKKCKCYEEIINKNKLEFAQIPVKFQSLAIKDFDINLYKSEENKRLANKAKIISKKYVEKFEMQKELGRGLFFYSKTPGSGKTRLAISIGNSLIQYKAQRVRFITTVDLLGKIRDSWNNRSEHSEEMLVNEFASIAVLILDDIGVEGNKEWIKNIFFRIMDTRLNAGLVTIITSNIARDNLEWDFRLKNRLEDMMMQVQMPEESVRSTIAKSKDEIMMKELLG